KVAGGNARQVRRRRSRHRRIWRDSCDGPWSMHVAPTGPYSLQFLPMRLEQFAMERMQSTYENQVEYNLSESGVQPLRLRDLLDDDASRHELMNAPLRYSQSNGTLPLRSAIAAIYPGTTADQIQVTNGGSEANYITTWNLVEPGDDVVLMVPNYMQTWGLSLAFGGTIMECPLVSPSASGGWRVDLEALDRLVTRRTKLIVIC